MILGFIIAAAVIVGIVYLIFDDEQVARDRAHLDDYRNEL